MVCMGEEAVVAAQMEEAGVIACVPTLRRSAGGTAALVLRALLWGQQLSLTGESWIGGVASVGDTEIDEAREGKVGGVILVHQTEIVFNMR